MSLCESSERLPECHRRTHDDLLWKMLKRAPCAETDPGCGSARRRNVERIQPLEGEPDIPLPFGEEDLVPLPFAVEEETVQEQSHLSTRECPAGVQVAEDIRKCHRTPDRIREVGKIPLRSISGIESKRLRIKLFQWREIDAVRIEED